MTDFIPELSELRMVARAPEHPVDFGTDHDYIFSCLEDIERSFRLTVFPGLAPERIPARRLIKQLITWWRSLEPSDEGQRNAHARLPGVIRLIDTYSALLAELKR